MIPKMVIMAVLNPEDTPIGVQSALNTTPVNQERIKANIKVLATSIRSYRLMLVEKNPGPEDSE